MPRWLRFIAVLCGSMALYFVLAGQISWSELAAGLPAAVAVAAFAVVQAGGQQQRLQLRAPWGRVLLRSVASLVTDSARVGAVLARSVAGRTQAAVGEVTLQPFRAGGEADAGRRAVVTLASSLAPNGFVMDVAPSPLLGADWGLMLHRLAPAPPDPDVEWPV